MIFDNHLRGKSAAGGGSGGGQGNAGDSEVRRSDRVGFGRLVVAVAGFHRGARAVGEYPQGFVAAHRCGSEASYGYGFAGSGGEGTDGDYFVAGGVAACGGSLV